MKNDIRCYEGRLLRSDPQHDDPYLETDVGQCPDCTGSGCEEDEEGWGQQKSGGWDFWKGQVR